MTTGVEVDGLANFQRTAARAADELRDLADAHDKAGRLLVDRARPRTRRRTGNLAALVRYDVDSNVTTLTDDADYAVFVHAYDPWLAETVEDSQGEVVEIFVDEIDRTIHTIHGK